MTLRLRLATPADARDCQAIYAPFVSGTAVSFEEEVPDVTDMAERITTALDRHAWLVAEEEEILGYAYAGEFKSRAAYRFTTETSIYLGPGALGRGIGRTLYAALLETLADKGFRVAMALIALPNPASEALHRSAGFDRVGLTERIGYKAGQWHDVAWFQRFL